MALSCALGEDAGFLGQQRRWPAALHAVTLV
jgi:hypothetical protein